MVEKPFIEVAPFFGWGTSWEEIEQEAVRDFVPNDTDVLGRSEETAVVVACLTSSHAAYSGGAVLRVHGGTIRSVR